MELMKTYLIDELQHGALNLVVSAGTVVEPGAADGVDLVEEDETGFLGTRHLEKFPHHPRALSHVLLHELRAYHADEACVGAVGHCTGAEGFAWKFINSNNSIWTVVQ